jgi:hypothetical protein
MEIVMFECDCCGKEHVIEDAEDFRLASADSRAPKNWFYVKFGDITADRPLDALFCEDCRLDIIKALGFESLPEYHATVQASSSEAKPFELSSGIIRLVVRGRSSNTFDTN